MIRPRSTTVAGLALIAAVGASACGTTGVRPDTSATARLDSSTGQVVLPLDEHMTTDEDETVMTQARLAIMRSCLQPKGHNGVEPPADSSASTEERPYGVWVVDRARAYGFHLPPSPPAPTPSAPPGGWSEESDPAFNAAYDECSAEKTEEMVGVSSPATSPGGSTLASIDVEARSLAEQDGDWKTARREWHDCLRSEGLTPREDDGAWTSQEAEALTIDGGDVEGTATAEEIRIATLEATCNEQTRLTQRLGDIEAGYQSALLSQHEAAVAEEKKTNAERLAAARAYLASHQ